MSARTGKAARVRVRKWAGGPKERPLPEGEEQRYHSVAELRIAIAALFRAGFKTIRIAVILDILPAEVEIELREYLLEVRP